MPTRIRYALRTFTYRVRIRPRDALKILWRGSSRSPISTTTLPRPLLLTRTARSTPPPTTATLTNHWVRTQVRSWDSMSTTAIGVRSRCNISAVRIIQNNGFISSRCGSIKIRITRDSNHFKERSNGRPIDVWHCCTLNIIQVRF